MDRGNESRITHHASKCSHRKTVLIPIALCNPIGDDSYRLRCKRLHRLQSDPFHQSLLNRVHLQHKRAFGRQDGVTYHRDTDVDQHSSLPRVFVRYPC